MLYNALSITQYENILGAVAQSIAAIASAGYYGTAVIPMVGEAPKEVYIARVYIMWIVLLILVAVIAFSVADIVYCLVHHLPFRRTTFLTPQLSASGSVRHSTESILFLLFSSPFLVLPPSPAPPG